MGELRPRKSPGSRPVRTSTAMPRYYFHLRDGRDILLDAEGLELDGVGATRAQALRSARSILAAEVAEGKLPLYLRIDVEDAGGAIVHRLPFADAVEVDVENGQD